MIIGSHDSKYGTAPLRSKRKREHIGWLEMAPYMAPCALVNTMSGDSLDVWWEAPPALLPLSSWLSFKRTTTGDLTLEAVASSLTLQAPSSSRWANRGARL